MRERTIAKSPFAVSMLTLVVALTASPGSPAFEDQSLLPRYAVKR